MTTQDYLKQAANNLRQAAQARKFEADELQRSLDQQLKDQQDQILLLKQRESQRLNEAARADDNTTTANRTQEATMLRTQESQIKSDLDKIKRDTDQLIKDKLKGVDSLNQLAQTVDGWS